MGQHINMHHPYRNLTAAPVRHYITLLGRMWRLPTFTAGRERPDMPLRVHSVLSVLSCHTHLIVDAPRTTSSAAATIPFVQL